MTRRRIIEPGKTWALSRRTTRRYFLLNPDPSRELEQCYWYCLGLAAKRHGVIVHAGCLMSTHSHEIVTDVRGELPRFVQEFHRLLAHTVPRDMGARMVKAKRPLHYFDSDNPSWPGADRRCSCKRHQLSTDAGGSMKQLSAKPRLELRRPPPVGPRRFPTWHRTVQESGSVGDHRP